MASKLDIYNGALFLLGQRPLTSLVADNESARVLNRRWTPTGNLCLEDAPWKWSVRAITSEASSSVAPTFGFQYAHQKPDDMMRLVGISENDRFEPPLTNFVEEAGYWYADYDPIYVRYTSNGTDYGWNVGAWTQTFANYVEAQLALDCHERLAPSTTKMEVIRKVLADRRAKARNIDAMSEGAKFMPTGSWARARMGNGKPTRSSGGWSF